MKKEIRNGVILLSIGIIESIGIILSKTNILASVSFSNYLNSKNVEYTNNSQSNVQDAIDDLYNKANNQECKVGYKKKSEEEYGYYCESTNKPICKRATTLHTEKCEQTDTSQYCSADVGNGNTITYGKIGSGDSLEAGEAFDCDVNGDGTYDSATERFYYITDLESNSDYAVLLYYKDTSTGAVAYDSANVNYNGPVTAVQSIPTTQEWSNVSLYETTRQSYATADGSTYITTTGNGSNTLGIFDYSGYAGRLLTYKELKEACPSASTTKGSLSNCTYLMENTKYSKSSNAIYGPWLEMPLASNSLDVWSVSGRYRYVSISYAYNSSDRGARPAIEVPKSKISR